MSVMEYAVSASQRRKVIAIDDSKTVLVALRRALEEAGFDVQTACDPGEIAPTDAQRAAAVIVDVQMEHVFGDDVVSFLREAWQVSVPILLFSSLPLAELVTRAQAAGASGAVCKTDGVGALLQALNEALENS